MRPATREEVATWDDLVVKNPDGGNFLQSSGWAAVKARQGWKPHFMIDEASSAAVLFLEKKVPGLGALWYAPKGPGAATLGSALLAVDRKDPAFRGCFRIEIEPEVPVPGDGMIERSGWVRRQPIQLTYSSMVLDLARPMEDIRAAYKPKTRYNVGVARRHGVRVDLRPAGGDTWDALGRLVMATLERRRYAARTLADFVASWHIFSSARQGLTFIASYEGEPVAGAFVVVQGSKAWYKDGGSSTEFRDVMAPALLHDAIIEHLRAAGLRSYDFGSVPPPGRISPQHPLYGLYRFKSGFGADHREYVGTLALPVRPAASALWAAGLERAALAATARLRGSSYY